MMRRQSSFAALDDAFFESYHISEVGGGRQGVKLAASLLSGGVQVLCTIERVANSCVLSLIPAANESSSRYGFLQLLGLYSSLESQLIVPLGDVASMVCEPRGPRGVITCGVRKHTGGGNKGFSFVCLDNQGVPGAGLTKAVALVLALNARVRLEINREAKCVSCRFDLNDVWNRDGDDSDTGRCRSQFASILDSAGLMGLYEQQFEQSGLDYQDLAVMNREDLKELVGISNRLHQIKIMTQIRLRFHTSAGAIEDGGDLNNGGSSQCYTISGADVSKGAWGRHSTGSGGSSLCGVGLDVVGISAAGVGRRSSNGDIPDEISLL